MLARERRAARKVDVEGRILEMGYGTSDFICCQHGKRTKAPHHGEKPTYIHKAGILKIQMLTVKCQARVIGCLKGMVSKESKRHVDLGIEQRQ